jgi:hypothetical protein
MKSLCALMSFLTVTGLGGCAYPSVRSAVYSQLGPNVIVMRPPEKNPSIGTARNDSTLIPGSILKPRRNAVLERDDSQRIAAEWGITSAAWCPVPSQLYRLEQTGPNGAYLNINIDYKLDVSLWSPLEWLFQGPPPTTSALRDQARYELQLSSNDLRYVRRIQIHITNVQHYDASNEELSRAKVSILRIKACRRGLAGPGAYQVGRIYSAQLYQVDIDKFEGASVNVGLLKGKIYKHLQSSTKGSRMFFALEASPL